VRAKYFFMKGTDQPALQDIASPLRTATNWRQVNLPMQLFPLDTISATKKSSPVRNRIAAEDRSFHDWYRFVLSFPPHLVREFLGREFCIEPGQTVLDPFCGTGTTIVEAKKLRYSAIGFERHPMSRFAARVKTDWEGDGTQLKRSAELALTSAERILRMAEPSELKFSKDQWDLLLADCISPKPLKRILALKRAIHDAFDPIHEPYALLALATTTVGCASNLHFGPEVGVRGRKADAPVFEDWKDTILKFATDLESARRAHIDPPCTVYQVDARDPSALPPNSVHAVFTSPPYPNEKDYTRTTRLESVLLGFIRDKQALRETKQGLLRSNTRTVYKDDDDDAFVANNGRVEAIANEIEATRIQLGKTSGFERLYARVTRLYFGGMARHLANLRTALAPGANLGYVVGDQASFFKVHIPTAELLAEIAVQLGYAHVETRIFRTRIATATKKQMEEHILWLRWPGA